MAIVNDLITFFGIDMLSSSSTFVDLLNVVMKIGVSLWLTIFIIRSMFLATSIGGRKFY